MSAWPRNWPYFSFQVATTWYGWKPKLEHQPAKYYRPHSRFARALANAGDQMSQAATHVTWGPVRAGIVWP